MRRSKRASALLVGGALVISSGLAACSSGGGTAEPGATAPDAAACMEEMPVKLPADVGAIMSLPEELQANYSHYPDLVVESPYIDFKSSESGPYSIAYSNSFSGNAWRAAALETLENNVEAYKELGIVSDLTVTDSNGDNTVQIQQMRALIQQKVSVIIAIPGSADALNGVIEEAYEAGIPVITLVAPVTTPYAINLDTSGFLAGANMATGLAKLLGGKGNIMTVQGIPGTSTSAAIEQGGNAVFERCPDIDIVANVIGEWSPSVAKTAMIQALATHPQQLDGVWQQGSMFMGITQALEQQGRATIPVTIGNPDQNSLAYWHDNQASGYDTTSTANSPTGAMDAAFRTAIRTLDGQGPKIAGIVVKPPVISASNLSDWYEPSYTITSTGIGVPPEGTWLPDSELDGFFANPAPLPPTPGR